MNGAEIRIVPVSGRERFNPAPVSATQRHRLGDIGCQPAHALTSRPSGQNDDNAQDSRRGADAAEASLTPLCSATVQRQMAAQGGRRWPL